ncbi:MAG: DUF5946 family protein [Anaerolineales bacterium]
MSIPVPLPAVCPACGGAQSNGISCEQHFHELLVWEHQQPDLGVVHHLTVLCYHIQHPHHYSRAGLETAIQLLVDFVRHGANPAAVRQQKRAELQSGQRTWKITPTPGDVGVYANPQAWSLTIQTVAAVGPQAYIENVRRWAAAVLADLEAAGNLPGWQAAAPTP